MSVTLLSKQEQLIWAVQEGADYVIGETFAAFGEAEIALKAMRDHAKGMAFMFQYCYVFKYI